MWRTCEHADRPCEPVYMRLCADLCAGSLFDFFPFSRRGLYSALDIGEYKRFDGSIYRNRRVLSLLILYVNVHGGSSYTLFCKAIHHLYLIALILLIRSSRDR